MPTLLPTPPEKHVLESFSLKGKIAIITGGSRGIGLSIVKAYAEAGADVALIYQSSGSAADTASSIAASHGVCCKAYQCNVSDKAAVDAMVDAVVADFGGLDIMVANAGVCDEFPVDDCTPERVAWTMDTNFNGCLWCARKAAAYWRSTGKFGNVVFTTSISAMIVNIPDKQAMYNASKAALVHLAKSMSVEWLGVCRVNCISPGYIATEMLDQMPKEIQQAWTDLTPSKRFGMTYELKGAYVFCASDASSFMTGGHIVIDGGYTVI